MIVDGIARLNRQVTSKLRLAAAIPPTQPRLFSDEDAFEQGPREGTLPVIAFLSTYISIPGALPMQTLTTQTTIDSDGTINIRVPSSLPPGPAEVVIVIQPGQPLPDRGSPSRLAGMFAGQQPSDFDALTDVRDIRHRATKEALELPE